MMIDFLKEVDTEKRSSKLKGEVSSNIPQYALHYTVSTCVCVCVCVCVCEYRSRNEEPALQSRRHTCFTLMTQTQNQGTGIT